MTKFSNLIIDFFLYIISDITIRLFLYTHLLIFTYIFGHLLINYLYMLCPGLCHLNIFEQIYNTSIGHCYSFLFPLTFRSDLTCCYELHIHYFKLHTMYVCMYVQMH